MMDKKPVYELPRPYSDIVQGPTLETDGGTAILSFGFGQQDSTLQVTIQFPKLRALRTCAEIYCTPWQVTETYEVLCEVEDSDWAAELQKQSVSGGRDNWVLRHFIIYLDDLGCVELIAESSSVEETVRNSGGT